MKRKILLTVLVLMATTISISSAEDPIPFPFQKAKALALTEGDYYEKDPPPAYILDIQGWGWILYAPGDGISFTKGEPKDESSVDYYYPGQHPSSEKEGNGTFWVGRNTKGKLEVTSVDRKVATEIASKYLSEIEAARELNKVEHVLTEIIDVLVSFSEKPCDQGPTWRYTGKCRCGWSEFSFSREGNNAVKALKRDQYYQILRPGHGGTEVDYQTLKVTGPVLKYITTINVCVGEATNRTFGGCDSVIENEIEVISKKLVEVRQRVLRGGSGAGVVTGQSLTCTFRKQ